MTTNKVYIPSFLHCSVFIVGNVHVPYFETELYDT